MNWEKMRILPRDMLIYIKEYIPEHVLMYSNKCNYSNFWENRTIIKDKTEYKSHENTNGFIYYISWDNFKYTKREYAVLNKYLGFVLRNNNYYLFKMFVTHRISLNKIKKWVYRSKRCDSFVDYIKCFFETYNESTKCQAIFKTLLNDHRINVSHNENIRRNKKIKNKRNKFV
jgi:hypothetical protein